MILMLQKLFAHYRIYHTEGPPRLRYMGYVGAAGTVLFYFIRFTRSQAEPWDDIVQRVIAFVLYLALALERRWPARLKRHYIGFSYAALLICLPLLVVLQALQRGGGVPAISNLFIMVSFLVLVTDWRNTLAMLGCGTLLASGIYALSAPAPAVPMDLVRQLPAYLLVLIGGGLFKMSTERIEAQLAVRGSQALAASIAHEMRNPLTQIRHGLSQIGRDVDASVLPAQADAIRRLIDSADRAARRGLQVISMTLDQVSARPTDRQRFVRCSAAVVTRRAVQEYAFESDDARARLTLEVREDFQVLLDETAYLHVLFNLFKNALYYVPLRPQTRVVVTVSRGCIEVHDTGPGISPDVLQRLFEPFASDKHGGSGLGLPYCRRVMRALGGEIRCRSVAGSYTCFTLLLPVSGRDDEALALAPAPTQEQVQASAATLQGRAVLVVDDHPLVRNVVTSHLRGLGMQVHEASHGQEALDVLARLPQCDAVLMDIDMPGLNGLETTRAIRASAQVWRTIPVIGLSAHSESRMREAAFKAGMNDLLTKPAESFRLRDALSKCLPVEMPVAVASAPATAGEHAPPPVPPAAAPFAGDSEDLLDTRRLEEFHRMGALEEFVHDYLPELHQLLDMLEVHLAHQEAAQSVLHRLLGVTGELGAVTLHAQLRSVYARVLEHHAWPDDPAWLAGCRVLARRSEEALLQWCARIARRSGERGPHVVSDKVP